MNQTHNFHDTDSNRTLASYGAFYSGGHCSWTTSATPRFESDKAALGLSRFTDTLRAKSRGSNIIENRYSGSLLLTDIEVEPPTREHPLKQHS